MKGSISQKRWLDKLPGILIRLLLAWCFSLLIIKLTLEFSGLKFIIWQQITGTLTIIILSALLAWFWQPALVLTAIAGAGALVGLISGYFSSDSFISQAENTSFWLVESFYWLIAQPNYFPVSSMPKLAILIGMLIAVACFWLVAKALQPWLMMISFIAIIVLRQSLKFNTSPWLLASGIFIVLLVFALKQTGWSKKLKSRIILIQPSIIRQAAIISVVTVIAAFFLSSIVPVSALSRISRLISISSMTDKISLNNTPVSENNSGLGYAGYYPLDERLGGPVNLSDNPVLIVEYNQNSLLLKGEVSDEYNGNSWQSLSMDDEYQYGNSLWFEYYNYIFDMNLPEQQFLEILPDISDNGLIIRDAEYEITPLVNGFRSLYHDGKPVNISIYDTSLSNILKSTINDSFEIKLKTNDDIYFNEGGVLYKNISFVDSQSYLINAKILDIDEYEFAAWYRVSNDEYQQNNQMNPDEIINESKMDNAFLQLPALPEYEIGSNLDLLTQNIIQNAGNSRYDKAIAIKNYLKSNYRYELEVEIPPENSEFVSWFLEQGEGYCVYFATALTMMCRIAGIPARYVEGYYVPPVISSDSSSSNTDSRRIITGQQAHAWTEIYLDNIGWIKMDATPGGGEAARQAVDLTDSTSDIIESTVIDPEQKPSYSNPNAEPDIDSDIDEEIISAKVEKRKIVIILLVVLFILLILTSVGLWLKIKIQTFKEKLTELWWIEKEKLVNDRIKLILPELLTLLRWNGNSWNNNQSWSMFVETIPESLLDKSEWHDAALSVEQTLFSSNILTDMDWKPVFNCYMNLIKATQNRKPELFWLIKIVIFGSH